MLLNFKNKVFLSTLILSSLSLSSCAQNASWHANQVAQADNNKLTLGSVQKDIKRGMSGGDVATILGSPNIVTTDESNREVWIYDKFSSEQVVSASNGLTFNLSNVAGGAARSSQSTLTVVIKFDANHNVRDIAYHKSSF